MNTHRYRCLEIAVRLLVRALPAAVVLVTALAATPAGAYLGPAATELASLREDGSHVVDGAGDANGSEGIPGDRDTRPASYDPADILAVRFETEYVAVPVGDDGVHYDPTALVARFWTLAAPRTDGPTIRWAAPAYMAGCWGRFQVALQGAAPLPTDPPHATLQWHQQGAACPDGEAAVISSPAWSASIDAAAKAWVWRIPFDSLTDTQAVFLAPGRTIGEPRASTETSAAGFASFGAILPGRIDRTPIGSDFVIGSDVPPDVPCTSNCP